MDGATFTSATIAINKRDGDVIGGVGVSSGTVEQDVAEAGAAAFGEGASG